ncbi:MAG: hypothetical protein NVSMB64_26150 [Candidatus Velthaea sp.]
MLAKGKLFVPSSRKEYLLSGAKYNMNHAERKKEKRDRAGNDGDAEQEIKPRAPQGDRNQSRKNAVGEQSGVYFIVTADERFVKIGYSRDITKRHSQIKTIGPGTSGARLLGYLPGTRSDEDAIHARFKAYRDSGEWFLYNSDVQRFICDEGLHAIPTKHKRRKSAAARVSRAEAFRVAHADRIMVARVAEAYKVRVAIKPVAPPIARVPDAPKELYGFSKLTRKLALPNSSISVGDATIRNLKASINQALKQVPVVVRTEALIKAMLPYERTRKHHGLTVAQFYELRAAEATKTKTTKEGLLK